ncbi:aldo/keto reductase [Streptomyces hirsutus]
MDLHLIHWPTPARDRYVDTYRAFEKLYAEGRIRAVGASKFCPSTWSACSARRRSYRPVNQIELHPHLQQSAAREYHAERGIATRAPGRRSARARACWRSRRSWPSPGSTGVLRQQVVLRWHLQLRQRRHPQVPVTPSRIKENIDVFGFSLDAEDLAAISALDEDRRLGPDPATVN